jgi:TolB-like protein
MSFPVKKLTIMFLLFIFSNPCFTQDEKKLQIALLDFSNTGGLSRQETITLSNRLRSMLVQTQALIVIERGKMEEILSEQGFQQTGCTTTECAVEAGKLLNVQKMVSGSIGKIGQTYTIDLSLIDVETAQIEKSFIQDYKGEIDGLLSLMQETANQIAISVAQQSEDQTIYSLSINSVPADAQIFINNKKIGNTPFKSRVREGMELEIKLQKQNYKDWTKSVSVQNDTNIDARLEFTDAYKKELAQKGKKPTDAGMQKGGFPWIWVGGGAIAGGVALFLISQGDTGNGDSDDGDQGFPKPPGRP